MKGKAPKYWWEDPEIKEWFREQKRAASKEAKARFEKKWHIKPKKVEKKTKKR
jgi:hypothetical protein